MLLWENRELLIETRILLRVEWGTNNNDVENVPNKPRHRVTLVTYLHAILDLPISLEMGSRGH